MIVPLPSYSWGVDSQHNMNILGILPLGMGLENYSWMGTDRARLITNYDLIARIVDGAKSPGWSPYTPREE